MFVSKLHASPSNGTPEMRTGSEYRKWVPEARDPSIVDRSRFSLHDNSSNPAPVNQRL